MSARVWQRLSYLRARGGFAAGVSWLAARALRIDANHVFRSAARPPLAAPHPPDGRTLLTLSSAHQVRSLDRELREQLERHSGRRLIELVDRAHTVFALIQDGRVVCQANVALGRELAMDTPRALLVAPDERSSLLQYLFTHEGTRRAGAARELLERVSAVIGAAGTQVLFAHVGVGNVPSLRTFRGAGWSQVGSFAALPGGWLVRSPGLRKAGIDVRPVPTKR
jgi:hypothetical protein